MGDSHCLYEKFKKRHKEKMKMMETTLASQGGG